jgi:hypothetical protein
MQMESFIGAIRTGAAIESDVMSAAAVQAVVDAVYRSAESGGMTVKPLKIQL